MIQASDVRSKVEDLISVFASFASEVESENTRSKILYDTSRQLEEKKKQLEERERKIADEEERQTQESKYIESKNSEIRKKEDLMDKRQVELNTLNSEYTSKRDELIALNSQLTIQLDKKNTIGKILDEREAECVKRESLILKEISIDRERKLQLDIREKKTKQREAELQRVMGN